MGREGGDISMVGVGQPGEQDSTLGRVPHHRLLHGEGQEELPSTLTPRLRLWLPLQTGG